MFGTKRGIAFLICTILLVYFGFKLPLHGKEKLDIIPKKAERTFNTVPYFSGEKTVPYFSGEKIRSLEGKDYLEPSNLELVNKDSDIFCLRWAVVTTIFKASEAVRIVARDPYWCLVIVGDKKTPPKGEYLADIGPLVNKTVLFLSPDDQEKVFPLLSRVIPWNDFRRKNIGYMYAIKHGAEMIWDFDDDNLNLLPSDILESVSTEHKIPCSEFSFHLLNPYPYYSVNETYTWPRGFPLEHVRTVSTVPKLCTSTERKKIGIIQSLANIEPDVDAIYRFTRNTPFKFGATPSSHTFVMVPNSAYSPLNAQATLWTKDAFLYLALPLSVPDRVCDIWRGYAAQYFFHKHGIFVSFVPPYIDQHRNVHDILKDFHDELDIYEKSNKLVEFLNIDVHTHSIIDLYKSFYEHGYLEQSDIRFIEAWTKTYEAT